MDTAIPLFFFLLLAVLVPNWSSASPILGFDIQHRFSDRLRQWAKSRPRDFPGGWPDKGTAEYYSALVGHDQSLRGRALDEVAPGLFFTGGNEIRRIRSLGFLYYAFVSLGNPSVTFLVALDTGSSLFWVPCNCTSCASTSYDEFELGVDLNIYNPSMSATGQEILCKSTMCVSQSQNECYGMNDLCPYMVKYVSAETSSSGFLVNDVLHLTAKDIQPPTVNAPIVFGCGQVQTGSFLGQVAPDGLFGLGMGKFSVPSALSRMGLMADSFSMCFGLDGLGRIDFGDRGESDQQETQFNLDQRNSSIYEIGIIGVEVDNNSSSNVSFGAMVDSGTSFTTFANPSYRKLSESFNAAVKEERAKTNSSIPFEYCYYLSSNESVAHLPVINLIAQGGSKFPVNYPIIFISNQEQRNFMYCLALVKSSKLNIIGQNFLTGLRVVFDRERMVFGWKKINCHIEDTDPFPTKPGSSSTVPSSALGPKKPGNDSQVDALVPIDSYSSRSNCFASIRFALCLLPLAFLW